MALGLLSAGALISEEGFVGLPGGFLVIQWISIGSWGGDGAKRACGGRVKKVPSRKI